jgi:hypothetical protein
MTRNVSIQTYLPKHVAAWVQDEANRARQSRSLWIGAIVTDLFQGQKFREEGPKNVEHIKGQLTFIAVALDGLLLEHPEKTLRSRVHDAHRRKVSQGDPAQSQ